MGPVSADAINRYLKQTRELFGDELFLDKPQASLKEDPQQMNPDFPSDLNNFYKQIHQCHNCALGDSRTEFVFGVGDPEASLVLVGEAPGEKEDLKGEPFVGRAGQLLDKILAAINRSRQKDVYICNVLKCRPPSNRDPLADEVSECEPYLIHQINLIQPKLIVALGRVAGKTLLNVDKPLKSMRGILHDYHGTPLIVTYHPAALLRNPNWKPETWKDFKWIRSIIDA
ncbi:MAG: uracil-DNA glycosylase [Candidatus Marinimicrobia bacterium]|nr:uracil-DNA glycosylase [Candidatus Neomarinimicrobiota bacterium]MBL7009787.1 uracil-DNA glycosylase [Candidatus Neomarinimicrobiota bacterium]MBL7029809.1 uracil-DNA glycosylase [Candidatus Neomarinimicrobiota bacterium]